MNERNEWECFLQFKANQAKLTPKESDAFLLRFCRDNLGKKEKEIGEILQQNCNSLENFKKQMTEVNKKFSKSYPELVSQFHKFKPLLELLKQEYQQWLSTPNEDSSASSTISIDWREICNKMLEPQLSMSTNSLLHAYEDGKFDRQQIYVPLALIERRKPDKREGGVNPETGAKLYEPEYEEKQRFEHEAFLEQILVRGEGKRKGKQIALIGEPGAGKTTLLQTIADWVLEREFGLPIWISLADLGQQATFNIWNYLQSNWLSLATSPTQKNIAETELEKQIQEGRVWLLLDGVDEVAASGIQTLQAIANQLRGWLSQSRVIVTCRLNAWEADKNALADFETYRLLDFDYPQQVHQFIDNWFNRFLPPNPPILGGTEIQSSPSPQSWGDYRGAGDLEGAKVKDERGSQKGQRLKAELENPDKARLRDLIQNPLRLTLLCASWQSRKGNLPETKAGLYAQFVQQFYKWKCDRFNITQEEKIALNQALGRLALQDIDTGNTRFRLRESFIREAMGNDSLFEKALQLGWLNNVGIAAESPIQEKVYAFFHASFEEYFAALAIDDWDYFIPRNHVDKPVEGKRYRIFEPQWKEVILLWLGREDVKTEDKEAFIDALLEFKDECKYFYGFRAYCLAAKGTAEFKDCSRADEMVTQIIGWGFGYLDREKKQWTPLVGLIQEAAKAILLETDRTKTIAILVELIRTARDESTRWLAAESLGRIGQGNPEAITALVELIRTSQNEFTRRQAAESLGRIGQGNPEAITALVELIRTSQNESTRWLAAERLGRIGQGNPEAITALVELIRTSQNEFTRRQAAESLGRIDPGNPEAITALVELIRTSQNESTRWQAAESLGRIGQGNPEAITALVELIRTGWAEYIRMQAAESLGRIGQGNPEAIAALVELIRTGWAEYIRMQAAESLGRIGQGNPEAIAALVELIRTARDKYKYTRRQVAESLGRIGQGNPEAIAALVKLIRTSQNEFTRRLAAEILSRIGQGNPEAIAALVELIRTSQNESTRRLAEEILSRIGQGNPEAIAALVELIRTSQNESTRRLAAEILSRIGQGNPEAIAALVELIGSSQNESTRRQAAESLGRIDPGNPEAITALVELIRTSQNESTRWQAAERLGRIVQNYQIAGVVTALKDCLSDATWENDRDTFMKCYKIIWKYAQTLSYPELYRAWHNLPITPHPEIPDTTTVGYIPIAQSLDLAFFPQLLHTAITTDVTLRDKVQLICLDTSRFIDPDNPAAEIYDQMLDLGYPERSNGEPSTLSQLKLYWHSLRRQSDKLLVMVLYHASNPSPEFSSQFLAALSKFEGAICLVSDESLSVSLQKFSPSQANLVEAILGWISRIVSEN